MYIPHTHSHVHTSQTLICTYFTDTHIYILHTHSYVPTSQTLTFTYLTHTHVYIPHTHSCVHTSQTLTFTYFSHTHVYTCNKKVVQAQSLAVQNGENICRISLKSQWWQVAKCHSFWQVLSWPLETGMELWKLICSRESTKIVFLWLCEVNWKLREVHSA